MSPTLILYASICMLTVGLSSLAWIDWKTGYLPDSIQLALGIGALTIISLGSPIGIEWNDAFIAATINGFTFWLLRFVTSKIKEREAMGLGDVKLVFIGGLWVGPWALPYIMLLAGTSTLITLGILAVIRKKPTWHGEIPLGPGLSIGIYLSYIGILLGYINIPF